MLHSVRIRGKGRVQVAAHGMGDAEHLLEKELRSLWPEARLVVTEVARPPGAERIVEEFSVSYRLEAAVEADAEDEEQARRSAFRAARDRLAASRYRHTSWEAIRSTPSA
jgi:hypothetical protein